MPRPRLAPADRLTCALSIYVTQGEQEAVDAMSAVYGRSELIRRAIALFVRTKYPELAKNLRKDLDTGPDRT